MNNKMNFHQAPAVSTTRLRQILADLLFNGRHRMEHRRNGKLLGTYTAKNDITNAGKNDILDVYFSDATQTAAASWVIGLISLTSYSGLAAADTMASHGGWTEFTSYSQTNRVAWGPGNPASQSITNATPDQFDITGSGTVKGIFVVNQNTKGGTTGTLWSTALFTADVPVSSGDQWSQQLAIAV